MTCSKCGGAQDRPGQRYCKACHREYVRATRRKHSELSPEQRAKANARSYANVYQGRGHIERKPCEFCGSADAHKHHPDYRRPLEVRWLCRSCHTDVHVFIDYHAKA